MNSNSKLFERAGKSIPGGVNSPVRAFKSVGGTPIFFASARGSKMIGEDGKEYIDYINSWGPMIMGHAYEPVVKAIQEQAAKSTSYGAPTVLETEMAELIKKMVPSLDLIRMVNSGTEACMSAVRVAKGYTKREKIIKFAGCYHGHADCFLIQAGSGATTLGKPNSDGVNASVAADTLSANFNDLENVEALLHEYPEEIAAIIVEPVAGNMGCIPPKPGFLEGLRSLCDKYGTVLIFDEVMTGFRLTAGGAQQLYKVQADLVTYGKIIGAGLPVGAFGGKKEIMECLAPIGGVYQAGTLSGNPIAMAAGYTLLHELYSNADIYESISYTTHKIHEGVSAIAVENGVPLQINRIGSMISLHFCENEVFDYSTAAAGNNEHFKKFFHHMLDEGIYLPPSAFETWFISSAIKEEEIERTLNAFGKFASNY